MTYHRQLGVLSLLHLGLCLGGQLAAAGDVVIARSASDSAVHVKRTGEILDYTGAQLTLRTALGRDEIIPASRIVEIQTAWSPSHEQARALRQAGKLSDAVQ